MVSADMVRKESGDRKSGEIPYRGVWGRKIEAMVCTAICVGTWPTILNMWKHKMGRTARD